MCIYRINFSIFSRLEFYPYKIQFITILYVQVILVGDTNTTYSPCTYIYIIIYIYLSILFLNVTCSNNLKFVSIHVVKLS